MKISELDEAIVHHDQVAKHTQEGTAEKVVEFLKTHCSDAIHGYKNGVRLYKGMQGIGNQFIFTDSSQIERRSQNTGNFYTEFLSKFSAGWKEMPPRNRSLICSTYIRVARGYGKAYFVFPVDGLNLGVCPDSDFWQSFRNQGISWMDKFVSDMEQLIRQWKATSMEEFLQIKIPKPYEADWSDVNPYLVKILEKFSGRTMHEALEETLDPTVNGFSLETTSQFYSNIHYVVGDDTGTYADGGNEVWFSGKCVLVSNEIMNDIAQELL